MSKAYVHYFFYQIFIFNKIIALQKLWKMFFISSKKLFSFSRYSNFYISIFPSFSLSVIALGVDPTYILKLMSAIFYQIFISSQNDSHLKTMKNVFLFHLKSSSCSRDIQIFVIFSFPFHTFQIQKDKWKWNNLWCHELACINLQM